ncbi:NAD(P)H-binding protein [Pacificimonas sp. WHA3]|uniref:NAD(P)H-binding protein n=1 Tax=Pacificimonas pallii TaxID=2827236 RepID=A0ABS6SEJ4_9SPHN|nr:NAD(P)H-binding protein [Pacificimonas pallii]MBV7256823.1 NAD(P)H-binding protein [Pacificimonas pallii]
MAIGFVLTNVWMIGGTGLVGRGAARRLRADNNVQLTSLVRRESGRACERLIDFDTLPDVDMEGARCDVAICCLGSTIGKAGSWEEFRKIDTGYVLAFAAAAKRAGARQFLHVSSVGARPSASNRYLAMKGDTEAGLASLRFGRLDIIRPGLLLGDRGEFRAAERAGAILAPVLNLFLHGRLSRYRAIAAERVAAALVALIGAPGQGRHIHHNRDIATLGR